MTGSVWVMAGRGSCAVMGRLSVCKRACGQLTVLNCNNINALARIAFSEPFGAARQIPPISGHFRHMRGSRATRARQGIKNQTGLASPAKEHPMATRLPASQRTREGLTSLILVSAPRDAVQVCCDRTNEWLKEIEEALGPDRHRAYQALRAVLHCLRDRLTLSEAAQLADQLPMLVRGIYYEAWHPAESPRRSGPVTNFSPGSARSFQGRALSTPSMPHEPCFKSWRIM
jgi:hypothetical protein